MSHGQAADAVVSYTYDAWGKVYSVTGSLADTLGQINPIRYRSYYYDTETGFYYLNSRYYDPQIRRFINGDGQLNNNQSLLGGNLFAYCYNNPVNMVDFDGNAPVRFYNGPVIVTWPYTTAKKYALSIAMLSNALYGKGKDLSPEVYALMEKKIKASLDYYYKIEEITDKVNSHFKARYTINFNDGDIYYAIHRATIFVEGKPIMDEYGAGWDLTVTVYDIYDFTEFWKQISLGAIANNIGYAMQKIGVIQPYDWSITFKQIWRH